MKRYLTSVISAMKTIMFFIALLALNDILFTLFSPPREITVGGSIARLMLCGVAVYWALGGFEERS